jgi:hypothetical protein
MEHPGDRRRDPASVHRWSSPQPYTAGPASSSDPGAGQFHEPTAAAMPSPTATCQPRSTGSRTRKPGESQAGQERPGIQAGYAALQRATDSDRPRKLEVIRLPSDVVARNRDAAAIARRLGACAACGKAVKTSGLWNRPRCRWQLLFTGMRRGLSVREGLDTSRWRRGSSSRKRVRYLKQQAHGRAWVVGMGDRHVFLDLPRRLGRTRETIPMGRAEASDRPAPPQRANRSLLWAAQRPEQ